MSSFSALDYVLFGVTLAISLIIGMYFAFQRKRAQTDTMQEFLTGNRQMPLFPTALSLLASYVSGIAYLGYPAEMYTMGTAFVWSWPGAVVAMLFTAIFIIPVIFHVESVSIYKYLEDRFDSKLLRRYGALLFVLSSLVYMAVVLYAPSTALAGVTGLTTWALILIVGVVCTIYTSTGGLKAVVWTDTFQSIVMYAGAIALMVRAVIAAGGISETWSIAKARGRIDGLTYVDPNPFQYMTLWTAFFGGIFYWLGGMGSNQIALQRYCSLPTLKGAQSIALLSIPAFSLNFFIVFSTGVAMFVYYANCDPMKDKSLNPPVNGRDRLVIHFVLDVLGDYYGLPGLFLACILSGTLSTISSGINSLAAVTHAELILPIWPSMQERTSMIVIKIVSVFFGAVTIGIAFLAEPLGGILQAVQSGLGAVSGPLTGLMLLGIMVPWANWVGGLAGAIVGSVLAFWVFLGDAIYKLNKDYTLPTTIACCNITSSACNYTETIDFYSIGPKVAPEGLMRWYALSFNMYSLVGCVSVLIVGMIVSALTHGSDITERLPHLVYWSRNRIVEEKRRPIRDPLGGKMKYPVSASRHAHSFSNNNDHVYASSPGKYKITSFD